MKEKEKDLLQSIGDEGLNAFLKSEVFKLSVEHLFGLITSPEVSALIGSILGAVAPQVHSIFLTYKQYRFERNIKILVEDLTNRVDDFENNYLSLNSDIQEKFKETYTEMLLDNIIDERQEEKIGWNINGFINLMSNDINENKMQLFFSTMMELTVLDIDTLRLYEIGNETTYRVVYSQVSRHDL